MAEGRHEALDRLGWAQASAVIAMIANAHRDPKRRPTPFSPDEFNPYAAQHGRDGVALTVDDLHLLERALGLE